MNVKLFWDLHHWGKLYFSNYIGRDNFNTNEKYESVESLMGIGMVGLIEDSKYTYNWGNITSSLRWNKAVRNKLFMNATLLYSNYSFENEMQVNTTKFEHDTTNTAYSYLNKSGVSDYGFFSDFDYYLSASHRFSFGTRLTSHHFLQRKMNYEYENSDGNIFEISEMSDTIAVEINSYLEDNVTLFDRWKINAGLHHSYFDMGDKVYSAFQPRISSSLQYKHWALKNSVGYMVQPIHNLVNNSNILKVDIWVPSEAKVKPSSSLQFDLGASWFFNDSYSLNIEGYWRKMRNIITYKSGESFLSLNGHWYDKVISGQGESYGIELLARKNEGKTTGWIAYTWSVCDQQFDKLNYGNPFPFAYDRRHYLTLSLNHQFSKGVQLSANWIFATGEPITLSTTAYNGDSYNGYGPLEYDYLGIITKNVYSPSQVVYLSSINNYRLPNYHRLDVGVD